MATILAVAFLVAHASAVVAEANKPDTLRGRFMSGDDVRYFCGRGTASNWTRDGGWQMRLARRIRARQVHINCYGAGRGIELSCGGMYEGGHGRENDFEALRECPVVNTIVFPHG